MTKLLNEKEFLRKYNLSEYSLEKSGLEWKQLEEIHCDYLERIDELEPVANYVSATLQRVPDVHSIRFRIKDSEHLIEKIIRKRLDDSTKEYSVENYHEQITDLIGVRALHLFKQDWENIHNFLVSNFDFAENPVANVREGDSKEFRKIYEEKGCEVKEHKAGYRSVHYLIKSKPRKQEFILELQVRTIFEEGWSEIDHRIRYPYDQENVLLGQLLGILNRLAGSADEMSSYITLLKSELIKITEKTKESVVENEKAKAELNEALQKLQISEKEKSDLRQRLENISPPFQVDPQRLSSALAGVSGILTSGLAGAMRDIEFPTFTGINLVKTDLLGEISEKKITLKTLNETKTDTKTIKLTNLGDFSKKDDTNEDNKK